MQVAGPIASDIPATRLSAKASPEQYSSSTIPSRPHRPSPLTYQRPSPTATRARPFFEISDGEDGSSNSSDERQPVQDPENTNALLELQVSPHRLKRWNVLMEMVHTEVGYLHDLRALVNIYFAVLPGLPLSDAAHQVVSELSDAAHALLKHHERFLAQLQEASARAVTATSPGLEEAMSRVAALFVMEAPMFDVYQQYCSTQPDAVRLLKPAQARAEWEAFEQICAKGEPPTPPSATKYRMPRTLSLVPTTFRVYGPATFFTEPLPPPPSFCETRTVRSQSYDSGLARAMLNASPPPSPPPRTKLRFEDFLIKPIQRICKYPLILEGLRGVRHAPNSSPTTTLIDRAIDTMRAVASRVDEARRLKDAVYKTRLILDRLDSPPLVSPDFLESLGICRLAGSLDVVHHHHVLEPLGSSVRVRYLGVFLFGGGYVLMVKVVHGRTGVVYRMKHWFAVASFEVVDIPVNRAVVPHSFRLSCLDHHFEIAASSEGEKAIWMRAMRHEVLQAPATQWTSEPVPSFHVARPPTPTSPSLKAINATTSEMKPSEPIQREPSPPVARSRVLSTSTASRLSGLRLSSRHRAHHRATSHPGQRLFSFESQEVEEATPPATGASSFIAPSVLIRRCSRSERVIVERELEDVVTDVIAAVRAKERMREEASGSGMGVGETGAGPSMGRTRAVSVADSSSSTANTTTNESAVHSVGGSSVRTRGRGHSRKSWSTGAMNIGVDPSVGRIPEQDEWDAPLPAPAKLKRAFSLVARNHLARAKSTSKPLSPGGVLGSASPATEPDSTTDADDHAAPSPCVSETGHTNANSNSCSGSPRLTRSLVGSVRGFVRRATLKRRSTTTQSSTETEATAGDELTDDGVLVEVPSLLAPPPVLPVLAHLRGVDGESGEEKIAAVREEAGEIAAVKAGFGAGGLGRRLRRSMLFT